MRNRVRGRWSDALKYGLFVGALSQAALPARADFEQSTSVTQEDTTDKVSTPMTERVAEAPYAVRFRITGFLARQHAREGNGWRSLVEFYSMLNVDDPSWSDDEQGDSMRISRDIEVAQMMTEVGFCDHAIRILQTSLILGCVNVDPQVVQIEFQMQATADVARLKGIPVPDIDMSFLTNYAPISAASSLEQAEPEPVQTLRPPPLDFPDTAPAPTGSPVVEQPGLAGEPNEMPRRTPERIVPQPAVPTREVESQTESRSTWSRLTSRWRQKKDIAPAAVTVQEDAVPERPTTSPAVSPTYCQECSGLHGSRGNVVVRYNPRTGITHTHLAGTGTASPMPSPYQKQFAPLQPANERPQSGAMPANPARIRRGIAPQSAVAMSPRDPSEIPSQTPSTLDEVDLPLSKKPESDMQSMSAYAPGVQQIGGESATEPSSDGSALTNPPKAETSARMQEPAGSWATAKSSRTMAQVGVAGAVSNPGIFALQGRSTTLAALLRRTGDRDISSDKKARILRAVEIRDPNSVETTKEFYCQRLDSIRTNTEVMETPIYGQEIVIVDDTAEKPIYLAVMPHFILQVPVDRRSSVTTEQIVEKLSNHWPTVRNQSIGLLRYDQWGSATNVSCLGEGDPAAQLSLSGGDVVYIDGSSLDRAEVLAAAESIAMLAGAQIRKHETAASENESN